MLEGCLISLLRGGVSLHTAFCMAVKQAEERTSNNCLPGETWGLNHSL